MCVASNHRVSSGPALREVHDPWDGPRGSCSSPAWVRIDPDELLAVLHDVVVDHPPCPGEDGLRRRNEALPTVHQGRSGPKPGSNTSLAVHLMDHEPHGRRVVNKSNSSWRSTPYYQRSIYGRRLYILRIAYFHQPGKKFYKCDKHA